MTSREELPEDVEDFAKLDVSLPPLADDTPESCPVPLSSVLEYLKLELPADELPPEALHFLRTARVQEREYWVWRLDDEYVDDDHYVTVWRDPGGTTCTGYQDNWWGLSLDQFLLAEYHGLL